MPESPLFAIYRELWVSPKVGIGLNDRTNVLSSIKGKICRFLSVYRSQLIVQKARKLR